MSSSRRSSATSTRTRSSLLLPARKSSQLSSVSFVHAEPEQPSAPPAGSAVAKLSPRLGMRDRQKKVEEDLDARQSVSKDGIEEVVRSDSEITLTVPAAGQGDDDCEAHIEHSPQALEEQDKCSNKDKMQVDSNELRTEKNIMRKSKSWFTFRRQPSISTFVAERVDAKSTRTDDPVTELASPENCPLHVSSERDNVNPQQEHIQRNKK